MEKTIAVGKVKVGKRFRKDFGDVKGLQHSIKVNGLLQSILVNKKNELLCGHRRLNAVKASGSKTIDVRVLDISDPMGMILAERDENQYRKELDWEERHKVASVLRDGVPEKGSSASEHSKKNGKAPQGAQPNTKEEATILAGFNNSQEYRRVGEVLDKGVPELKKALVAKKIKPSLAAKMAQLTPAQQRTQLQDHLDHKRSGPINPLAALDLFNKLVEHLQKKFSGWEDQFGSMREMFDSPLWAAANKRQKRVAIDSFCDIVDEAVRLRRQMVSYRDNHL